MKSNEHTRSAKVRSSKKKSALKQPKEAAPGTIESDVEHGGAKNSSEVAATAEVKQNAAHVSASPTDKNIGDMLRSSASKWPIFMRRHGLTPYATILALIIMVGGLIRLPGVYEGLPYAHHWDEPFVLHSALDMIKEQHIIPDYWLYPHFYIYAQAALAMGTYVQIAGEGDQKWPGVIRTYLKSSYIWEVDHPNYYRNGRLLTLAFGLVLLGQIAWGVKRAAGRKAALVAAMIAALHPILIVHATKISVDTPATVFSLGVLMVSVSMLSSHKKLWKGFLLAGILGGLATATKYTYYPSLLLPIIAFLLHPTKKSIFTPSIVLLPIGAALAFLVAMPGAIIQNTRFLWYIGYQYGRLTSEGIDISSNEAFLKRVFAVFPHLFSSLSVGLVTCVAIIGWVCYLWRGRKLPRARFTAGILLIAWGLINWSSHWKYFLFFDRYIIPMIAVLFAPGVALVTARFLKPASKKRTATFAMAGLGLLCSLLIVTDLKLIKRQLRAEPRFEAVEWMNENLPKDAKVAIAAELHLIDYKKRKDIVFKEVNRTNLPAFLDANKNFDWVIVPERVDLWKPHLRKNFLPAMNILNIPLEKQTNFSKTISWKGGATHLDSPAKYPGLMLYERESDEPSEYRFPLPDKPRNHYLALEAHGPAPRLVNSLPGITQGSHGSNFFPVWIDKPITRAKFTASAIPKSDAWPVFTFALQNEDGVKFRGPDITVDSYQRDGTQFSTNIAAPPGKYMGIINYWKNSLDADARPILMVSEIVLE